MARNDADFSIYDMVEAEMRQWVEANPGRVNDKDSVGYTLLCTVVEKLESVPLILWLVNEKGADVNVRDADGYTPIHFAESLDVINTLLDCGADPTLVEYAEVNMLIFQLGDHKYDVVARLLQDPRIRAIVNEQDMQGDTALHIASLALDRPKAPAIIQLLLQAGADMNIKNANRETPLDWMQRCFPTHPTTLALPEQMLDAERASFLVKARRLVIAATRAAVPSYLQGRMACGLPLPRVALAPVVGGENDDEDEEARRKLRTALAFLVGMEGGGMPRDVFRVVLDPLMPPWDPLRRKEPIQEGGGQPRSE